jgi:mevalonate kinase
MELKLVLAISALAAMPALAQAQQGGRPPNVPMPTKAEIQKVIQIVSSDKTKTQQYCEIGKINQQMAQADQKNDTKSLETLGKQADDLAEKIGPEFVKLIDALDQMDENSSQGKELMTAVETLDKLCTEK